MSAVHKKLRCYGTEDMEIACAVLLSPAYRDGFHQPAIALGIQAARRQEHAHRVFAAIQAVLAVACVDETLNQCANDLDEWNTRHKYDDAYYRVCFVWRNAK